MAVTPEEFKARRAARRLQRAAEIARINAQKKQSKLDPNTPLVLSAVEDMREQGRKEIKVRDIATGMKQDGEVDGTFTEVCSLASSILNSLDFKIAVKWPTVFAMPETLPVVEDGRITSPIRYEQATTDEDEELDGLISELGQKMVWDAKAEAWVPTDADGEPIQPAPPE
jgi:hypothetical protein